MPALYLIYKTLFSITVCVVNPPRVRRSFERHPSREVQQYSCAKVLPLTLGAGHHQWPGLGWHSHLPHARAGAPAWPTRLQKFQQVTALQVESKSQSAKFKEADACKLMYEDLFI